MATAQNIPAPGATQTAAPAVATPAHPLNLPQIDPMFGFTTYITPHDNAAQFRVNLILTLQSASAQFIHHGQHIEQVEQGVGRLTTAATDLDNGVQQLKSQVTTMEERLTGVEGKLTDVEGSLTAVEDRLAGVEDRLTVVETGLSKVNDRLTGVETKLVMLEGSVMDLDKKLDKRFDQLLALLSERLPAPAIEVTRPSSERDTRLPAAPSGVNTASLHVEPPFRDDVAGAESGPSTLGKRKYKSLSSLRSIFTRRS